MRQNMMPQPQNMATSRDAMHDEIDYLKAENQSLQEQLHIFKKIMADHGIRITDTPQSHPIIQPGAAQASAAQLPDGVPFQNSLPFHNDDCSVQQGLSSNNIMLPVCEFGTGPLPSPQQPVRWPVHNPAMDTQSHGYTPMMQPNFPAAAGMPHHSGALYGQAVPNRQRGQPLDAPVWSPLSSPCADPSDVGQTNDPNASTAGDSQFNGLPQAYLPVAQNFEACQSTAPQALLIGQNPTQSALAHGPVANHHSEMNIPAAHKTVANVEQHAGMSHSGFSLSDPLSGDDELVADQDVAYSSTALAATTAVTGATDGSGQAAQVPASEYLQQTKSFVTVSQLGKKSKFKKGNRPNRPWLFGYTFPGSQYALYYLTCPTLGCAAVNTHPLIKGRGAEHMRACGGNFVDEQDMIRKYGTQVTTDKLSVLLDWARQWNKDILKDNGNDHLAFENFPAMVQQQEQNK